MRLRVSVRISRPGAPPRVVDLPAGPPVLLRSDTDDAQGLLARSLGEGRVRLRVRHTPFTVEQDGRTREVDERTELDLTTHAARVRLGPDVFDLTASALPEPAAPPAALEFADPPPPPRPVVRRRVARAPFRAPARRPVLPRAVVTSCVSHALAILVLMLLFALATGDRAPPPRRIALRWAPAPPPALDDPEARAGDGSDSDQGQPVPADASRPTSGEDGEGAADAGELGRALDALEETTTEGVGGAPAGRAFAGRAAARRARLAAGGGEAEAEGAVQRALDWLARHQRDDGAWSARDFAAACPDATCAGAGASGFEVGTTGLALLPFLGAGHGHLDGPFADTVRRGLAHLLGRQREDGTFARGDVRGYEDALATFALAEAFGLTRARALRAPAERAVAAFVRTQSEDGGWRYHPGDGTTDTSVTAWVALALCAARRAGVAVPERTLAGCRRWLRRVIDADGSVGYRSRHVATTALTGAGLAVALFLGENPARAPLERVVGRLAVVPPRWDGDPERGRHQFDAGDPSHWYYGSLAAFQVGGGTWRTWSPRLRDLLVAHQRRDGHALGSFDLRGRTGHQGGRVVMTALCALSLEAAYRYPRLAGWRIATDSAVPSSTPR